MTEMVSGLTAVQEDYLEAIYRLTVERKVARNKEIAEALGVKTATVTGAVQHLAELGYVNYESHGYVTLTAIGAKLARELLERHELFYEFFHEILGLDEKVADEVACRTEHHITGEPYRRFRKLVAHFQKCPHPEKYQN
ncbi:MAG TPA: metal-dependent transcriptional regulator [bacterium]|nr:metal-dependent transcriptional regulator [bacterium]